LDTTLLAIILLLVFATILGVIQQRRRDKCLKHLDGFHVTLAEKGGDLTWGDVEIFSTGLEITYNEPVQARQGHLERSFLFYKDQYGGMDAVFRYPEGLPPEEQERRRQQLRRTVDPSLFRRTKRTLRNWLSIVRDAAVQAASLAIGAAKARSPGSAVLSSQEGQLKALSGEIIGHVGNAFDPLLESHLFTQVVVEVTTDGTTRSYCGWLKDYSAQFIEVLDAFVETQPEPFSVATFAAGDAPPGVTIRVEGGSAVVQNAGQSLVYWEAVEANRLGEATPWRRTMGVVLPPATSADLTLPPGTDAASARFRLCRADRVDLVVPRTHALVRHGARGSTQVQDAQGASFKERARQMLDGLR
jgi:hypothetical protein